MYFGCTIEIAHLLSMEPFNLFIVIIVILLFILFIQYFKRVALLAFHCEVSY